MAIINRLASENNISLGFRNKWKIESNKSYSIANTGKAHNNNKKPMPRVIGYSRHGINNRIKRLGKNRNKFYVLFI